MFKICPEEHTFSLSLINSHFKSLFYTLNITMVPCRITIAALVVVSADQKGGMGLNSERFIRRVIWNNNNKRRGAAGGACQTITFSLLTEIDESTLVR